MAYRRAAELCGLNPATLIPALDGRLTVGGWTVEPLLLGHPAGDADVRLLRPMLMRWQARTRNCRRRPGHPWLREALHLPKPLLEIVRAVVPDTRPVAVHGDIHAGNLLRLSSGRLALIDWEEARADHGSVDLLEMRLISSAGRRRLWLSAEVSACWKAESERGRQLARQLRSMRIQLDLPRRKDWP